MNAQNHIDFNRIKDAIEYIDKQYKNQPSLEDIARHVNLSPFHFQRMFVEWSGITPKQFLQFITIGHAKQMLEKSSITLFDTAYEVGLSGTSRLHDLFIKIEGMTPGEYKNGGENLFINYSFTESPFGKILIASTQKGICHMAFVDNDIQALERLKNTFPNAQFNNTTDPMHKKATLIFNYDWEKPEIVKLHVKGSEFQLKVWETLLKIPSGEITSYGNIAKLIEQPSASRAVGTAIGHNPIAYLIPCHRVIQSTGVFGNYMWENSRKAAIIGWESAKRNKQCR